MAALKYWNGTSWQTLAAAASDSLEWIDLGLPADQALPWAATLMPFTTIKGGAGITVNGSGQMVIQKAGVYHVTASIQLGNTPTQYVVSTLRQWRAGAVISVREMVPYTASNAWDTGTAIGNFDAQAGDLFDVICTPGGTGTIVLGSRSQFTAHRLSGPGTPQALNAASVALQFDTGGGGWTSAAPGPGQGIAFTTPAGVFRGTATATAYASSAGTNVAVEFYIDQVLVGTMRMNQSVVVNAHMALAPLAFSTTVTAGTHYAYFKLTGGLSSATDYGTIVGTVTSAAGQLTDAPTLLNARLTADQAIGASVFTKLTGWTINHAYPTWAPENSGVFTIPADGYYRIDFMASQNATSGPKIARIAVNGVSVSEQNHAPNASFDGVGATWWEGNLRTGDLVDFWFWAGAAGNIQVGTPPVKVRFTIRKLISGGIPASGGAPDTPWTPFTYVNGWSDYGSPWETGAYRRVGGVVYLRGLIRNGAARPTQDLMFNLPAGFRSSSDQHIGIAMNGNFGIVNIYANGNVTTNTAPAAGVWYSMRIPPFPADQ